MAIETKGWAKMNWTNNFSLLHWTAKKGHADWCAYLLLLGADADLRDAEGKRPGDHAREQGHAAARRSKIATA